MWVNTWSPRGAEKEEEECEPSKPFKDGTKPHQGATGGSKGSLRGGDDDTDAPPRGALSAVGKRAAAFAFPRAAADFITFYNLLCKCTSKKPPDRLQNAFSLRSPGCDPALATDSTPSAG
ncbi:hypothetical protein L596_002103 [Steinernema carpocapsae]|uniref:Uncharacterized protein n=1 Tax=Steinernema carpocapsae TaxID=34508 RepID=A0A4U8UN38_STECR|nr:hypothetical protein L596_002103 [Steinernema carpocapsae]